MLSRAQQILLKRAQAQAGVDDAEYRSTLETLTGLPGCTSSKDARLTDGHLDKALAYFEAIYWRKVDKGEIVHHWLAESEFPLRQTPPPFQQRGYWAGKNTKASNSRDRYVETNLQHKIHELEQQLVRFGCSLQYLSVIQNKTRPGGIAAYKAALERTLKARNRTAHPENERAN